MNVADLQQKKQETEDAIAEAVMRFSQETGFPVSAIRIQCVELDRVKDGVVTREYGYPSAKLEVQVP